MLYGFTFFLFFYFFIFLTIIWIFKILSLTSLNKFFFFFNLLKIILNFFLFFLFFSLIFIYYFFEFFFNFIYVNNQNFPIVLFTNFNNSFFYFHQHISTSYASIFFFPFIYIFLLITALSIFFCLSYSINETLSFSFYCGIIFFFGYLLFFTNSLLLFFFSYEMLLIPSFFILYKFAKTKRCIEAAYLMFFWTQFGALFLIFSFLYLFFITKTPLFNFISELQFSKFEINFFFFCWIIGFGVKLPIWPFYGWLPKAHVEASTNFSIFLSGVLVKFAFFGLLKCLTTLQLEPTFYFIYPFLFIGLSDSVFKLFYQIDLKKLIAYSTVIEMHWLTICIISGQSPLMLSSFCMLISHAFLSTNWFLLVDAINRRFKTRIITEINGLNFLCPKLFLLTLINSLIFLGFPGSIFFIAEFLFFCFFLDTFPLLSFLFLFLLYLLAPTFFFKNWMNVMFGYSINSFTLIPLDLNKKEFFLYFSLIILMFWLGLTWQSFIF